MKKEEILKTTAFKVTIKKKKGRFPKTIFIEKVYNAMSHFSFIGGAQHLRKSHYSFIIDKKKYEFEK